MIQSNIKNIQLLFDLKKKKIYEKKKKQRKKQEKNYAW